MRCGRRLPAPAAPGARVIFRTGGTADILPDRVRPDILNRWAYDAGASARGTAQDRSAIYGRFPPLPFSGLRPMLDSAATSHAALMDETYRHQRLFYDLTRKYYLFGRDRLISELKPKEGAHVLEVACGTGRNLQVAARKYPQCAFYGLDISAEMLTSARAKVHPRVQLAQADACGFDGAQLFRPRPVRPGVHFLRYLDDSGLAGRPAHGLCPSDTGRAAACG